MSSAADKAEDGMGTKDLIGWGSSLLLIITFGSQTYSQWKSGKEQKGKYGVELVFFSAAIGGSVGNLIYSYLVRNWVFTVLNAVLVVNNSLGLAITVHKRKGKES